MSFRLGYAGESVRRSRGAGLRKASLVVVAASLMGWAACFILLYVAKDETILLCVMIYPLLIGLSLSGLVLGWIAAMLKSRRAWVAVALNALLLAAQVALALIVVYGWLKGYSQTMG